MMALQRFLKKMLFKLTAISLCFCAVLSLAACDLAENTLKPDREASLEMQDYRDALASRVQDDEDEFANGNASKAGIPELQPYIASGDSNLKSMPLVSISVNQSVPLRDVLFELAQQADYDLELDPRIRGSVIFTARERPLDEVVERIADMAGLRYELDDQRLRIELDEPYNKLYKIDYLSYIRSTSSGIRNDIAVVSGDGADTGSNFEATSETEIDFWGELEGNLTQILGVQVGALRTRRDPRVVATEANPDVQAVAPPSEDGAVQVQPPEAVLRVDTLPVDGDDEDTGSSGGSDESANSPTFSINKQAGLINVYAPKKLHKEIQDYLKILKKSVTSQVLIEAKVLEVTLSDEYATGIDWRAVDFLNAEGALNYLSGGATTALDTLAAGTGETLTNLPSGIASDSGFVVGIGGNDIQALIRAVSQFGTVKALASPRLTVLNNQSAVLNVADNRVFFEIDIEVTTEDNVTTTEVDSEIRNVPEGVLINVQPSINLDEQTIAMSVRPTITRVVAEIDDPATAFVVANAGLNEDLVSQVPELNVQEIDSVIMARSGQPIVMGGLLQDRVDTLESGVPVLSEVPVMGALFRGHDDQIQKTELVIFLQATILKSPSDSVHDTDKDLYRKFSSDRRPFKL